MSASLWNTSYCKITSTDCVFFPPSNPALVLMIISNTGSSPSDQWMSAQISREQAAPDVFSPCLSGSVLLPLHYPRHVSERSEPIAPLTPQLQLKTMYTPSALQRARFRREMNQTRFLPVAAISCSFLVITFGLERRLDVQVNHVHRVVLVRSMYRLRLPVFLPFPVFLKQIRERHQ